jgi:hypothetical protein
MPSGNNSNVCSWARRRGRLGTSSPHPTSGASRSCSYCCLGSGAALKGGATPLVRRDPAGSRLPGSSTAQTRPPAARGAQRQRRRPRVRCHHPVLWRASPLQARLDENHATCALFGPPQPGAPGSSAQTFSHTKEIARTKGCASPPRTRRPCRTGTPATMRLAARAHPRSAAEEVAGLNACWLESG